MEAIFADTLDLTYVGPESRDQRLRAVARRGDPDRGRRGERRRRAGGAAATPASPEPADFRGKRIATPQLGNTQDVAAAPGSRRGGLRVTQTGGDAQVLPTANPDQLALFQRRQLDAVWTVEPWVSRLELEAGGKVLRRGEGRGHHGARVAARSSCADAARPGAPLRRGARAS